MVGKIYESKRTEGVKVKVIKFEEKFKTVIIEYLTGDKTGTSSSITTATLKRWWEEIEVINETDEALELLAGGDSKEQAESVIAEKELTDEEYAKIGLEIAEQAKKKTEEHKKSKKISNIDRSKEILELDAFIGNTYNNKYYESVKCYKIIKNEKTVAEIYPRKKEIEVRVKSIKDNFDSDVRYKDGYKYYLPVHYFLDYTSDYIKLITDLIQ